MFLERADLIVDSPFEPLWCKCDFEVTLERPFFPSWFDSVFIVQYFWILVMNFVDSSC